MIAFEELVAALDRWRLRNGLPVASLDIRAAGTAAPAAAVAPPATYGYAPAPIATPRTAPPAAPPSAAATVPRPATDSDVLALGDDEMVDEADVADAYDNEGDDYAVNFAGNPVGAVSGSIGSSGAVAAPDEPTAMGALPGAAPQGANTLDHRLEYMDDDPAADPDDEYANSPATPPAGTSALTGAPIPHDTLDAEDDVIDEATVVGGDDHRR